MKRLLSLASCLILLGLLLTGCHSQSGEAASAAPSLQETAAAESTALSPASETPEIRIEEIPLEIDGMNEYDFQIKDTNGPHILYVLQETRVPDGGWYSYYVTHEIGIYNTDTQSVERAWSPEQEGWYFAGALSADDSAVMGIILDYENVYPSDYAIASFTPEGQSPVDAFSAELQSMASLDDGTTIFSYSAADSFGVKKIVNGEIDDILHWELQPDACEPLAGSLSVQNNTFTYECVQDGCAAIICADASGELSRSTLDTPQEKLYHHARTENGMVFSLSIGEDSTSADKEFVYVDDSGTKYTLETPSASYRMAFAGSLGLCVNGDYTMFYLNVSDGSIQRITLPDFTELDPALKGEPVGFARRDGNSLYVYYTEIPRLFVAEFTS